MTARRTTGSARRDRTTTDGPPRRDRTTTAIELKEVTVAFDGVRALDELSHSVSEGAWLGVIGPNGAGKTTLLRAIAGLVGHSGEIKLRDEPVGGVRRKRLARLVAFVPQRPFIPPGVAVTDYVLMGRSPYISYLGRESRHDLRVVGRVLERLALDPFARRPLDSLSGGELQRVVLARALAQEAPVLLLDEPTSFLDIGHQQQVLSLVDELRIDHRLTIVSAMHDLTLAGQFADTLLLLSSGRGVAAGTARSVLTENVIHAHYGAAVRVLESPDGGVLVIPVKPPAGSSDSGRAVPS